MRRYKALPITPPEKVDPIPVTGEFMNKKQSEYNELKKLQAEVKERLKEAREKGDLSENGAYKYAKFELGTIGRKLHDIQFILTNGYVSEKTSNNSVGFGNTVTLEEIETKKSVTYTLLSELECDPSSGSISLKSPLGKLLLGKKIGDTVSLVLPTSKKQYRIQKIT